MLERTRLAKENDFVKSAFPFGEEKMDNPEKDAVLTWIESCEPNPADILAKVADDDTHDEDSAGPKAPFIPIRSATLPAPPPPPRLVDKDLPTTVIQIAPVTGEFPRTEPLGLMLYDNPREKVVDAIVLRKGAVTIKMIAISFQVPEAPLALERTSRAESLTHLEAMLGVPDIRVDVEEDAESEKP